MTQTAAVVAALLLSKLVSAKITPVGWRKFSLSQSGIHNVVSSFVHSKLGHCHINTGKAEIL